MEKFTNSLNLQNPNQTIVVGIKENMIPEGFAEMVSDLTVKKKKCFDFNELTNVYPKDMANIVFVGLGDKKDYSLKDIQTIASKIAKEVKEDAVINIDSFVTLNNDKHDLMEKIVETILLVNYEFNDYKTMKKDKKTATFDFYSTSELEKAFNNGRINAEATNHARTLVNEPRNKMTPRLLAQYANELGKNWNIDVRIYNKKEIEDLGMGAFLAVNQGSKEEAKLIHLQYRGASVDDEITTLVGKGLTYDSGGYSIKPKNGMAGMKGDMGGAASVLGAIEIIARKKLKVNVDVVIAATENLISNEAMVPDDVIVAMNGKTIEVLNTDAEGRLTLVDAVTFAKKNDAKKIIDVATLTGGIVTALGTEMTGVFTNNAELLNKVKKASENTGEVIWQMPVDEFRDRVKQSNVADYNNSPGRDGHASFAAAIIAEFAEDTPWVHLDIAGTSGKGNVHLLGPKGATGVMVRTLANFFE